MKSYPTGTVTFLFTDIEDSTRLWQEQPQAMAAAHARHDAILRQAIAGQQGYIFQVVGDSFSAAFHQAPDGLRAALEAQRRLQDSLPDSLQVKVRMGLHTGSAEIREDGKYDGYVTVASAQRVMSAAHGGQVLLSQVTADLLGSLPEGAALHDLGEHQLKSLRSPVHLYQLAAPGLAQEFPPIQSLNAAPGNLPPQLTSFVGREKQLADTARLLAGSRLLTLTGSGGTGKTRLALELAEAQLVNFQHGAWLVELAPVSDAKYIVSTVNSVFSLHEVQGASPLGVLTDYLRDKQLLLLLDNCEHLVEACAQLAHHLLQECPALKILASSREALGASGESVYRVPSLPEEEARRLFIERAAKADARFRAAESSLPFINQVCARLDGIPLAIELAAARVALFSVQQIAERLNDRFKLLTGGARTAIPRQQTLRALIDWSYQLLNASEQRALRGLAVFSGGWSYEAAEALIGEAEALDCLTGLVNKSLVNVDDQDGQSRYSYLETIRQYASEKLVEAGEAEQARSRHLRFMVGFVKAGRPEYDGMDPAWLDRLDRERDNLRAALDWAVNNHIEEAIDLALNSSVYWSSRDYISEALHWLQIILEKSEGLESCTAERAAVYSLLGWNSILVGHHRDGRAASESAMALAQKSGADRAYVLACCTLALASIFLGDNPAAQEAIDKGERLARQKDVKQELAMVIFTKAQMVYFSTRDGVQAKTYLEESIRLSRDVGNRWDTAFQVFGQARLAASLGDMDSARSMFNQGTEIARRIGNKRMTYSNRSELAHALREHGLLDEALGIYREIIPGWKELGHRAALAHELECVGYILARQEEPERAVRLLSAAQVIRRAIDTPRTRLEEAEYVKELASLRALLGEPGFQACCEAGERLTSDQAIELAGKG